MLQTRAFDWAGQWDIEGSIWSITTVRGSQRELLRYGRPQVAQLLRASERLDNLQHLGQVTIEII